MNSTAGTTAAAPATKSAKSGHPQSERSGPAEREAEPPSSNTWSALTPEAAAGAPGADVPQETAIISDADRGRLETMGLSNAAALQADADARREHLEQRARALQEAAPGASLDEAAAAGATGLTREAAEAAMPRPTLAAAVDADRLTEEDKQAPGPFLRKETGT